MTKKLLIFLVLGILIFGLSACKTAQTGLQDGYYTVEMSDYEHGWKEFVTICISGSKIVSAEYNARNSSGYIKSWDMAYMKNMCAVTGTYPNQYTRAYAASFLQSQDAEKIDGVSGATHSGGNFAKMTALLMEKAKIGDTSIGVVKSGE